MTATVYFAPVTPEESIPAIREKVHALWERAAPQDLVGDRDLVALKVHFGEKGNQNFIRPPLLMPLVERVRKARGRPFWTDTNTLYTGPRANAVDHIRLAHDHGFSIEETGCPVIIADGPTGREEVEVEVGGRHSRKVGVAAGVSTCDALVVASHATGHLVAGFGATLKNLGMGLSSRKGKLYQHSVVKPWVDEAQCRGDWACMKWCPVDAIEHTTSEDGRPVARIVKSTCIGCGECLSACRPGAIRFAWKMASPGLQERMAEQAMGVVSLLGKRMVCFCYLLDVSRNCDCLPSKPEDMMLPALGVAAATDPVALDQACLDLIEQRLGGPLSEHAHDVDPTAQIAYAEELGMGTRQYERVDLEP